MSARSEYMRRQREKQRKAQAKLNASVSDLGQAYPFANQQEETEETLGKFDLPEVDLPESSADSLPDDQEPLTLSINSKGEVFIQEHQVDFEKIVPKILAISNNRTDTRIYVRGDRTINYGRVLEIMGRLSGAGFSKVALISEPYKN